MHKHLGFQQTLSDIQGDGKTGKVSFATTVLFTDFLNLELTLT